MAFLKTCLAVTPMSRSWKCITSHGSILHFTENAKKTQREGFHNLSSRRFKRNLFESVREAVSPTSEKRAVYYLIATMSAFAGIAERAFEDSAMRRSRKEQ